jgi:hypothetical protein
MDVTTLGSTSNPRALRLAGLPGFGVSVGSTAYIILGERDLPNPPINVLNLNGKSRPRVLKLTDEKGSNWFSVSISGEGDVNGDTYPDAAIGVPSFDNGRGAIYVVYGQSTFSVDSIKVTDSPSSGISSGNSSNSSSSNEDLHANGKEMEEVCDSQVKKFNAILTIQL